MSSITKDQLIFDTSAVTDSDSVGAFVRSSDGTLIDHETINTVDRLAVDTTLNDGAGNDITSTGGALDVNLASSSLADLDIRDLINTQDSIAIGDEVDIVDMQQIDTPFELTAQAFPIAGVRRDADTSPVGADGDTHPLVFDDAGQLKVRASVVAEIASLDAEYVKGTAAGATDVLLHMGVIRSDVPAHAAGVDDGDYTSLLVDDSGRLWTNAAISGDVADDAADSGNPLKTGTRSVTGALSQISANNDRADMISDPFRRQYVNDTANISAASSVQAITDSATAIGTSLAGRRLLRLQNTGGNEIYIGATGVTDADGQVLRRRTNTEIEVGPDVALFAVCETGEASELRVLEIA